MGELPIKQTVFVQLPDTCLPNPDANNLTQLRNRLSVSWHLVELHV